MDPRLEDNNWQEAFKYANGAEKSCRVRGHDHTPHKTITSTVSEATFDRDDVEFTFGMLNGENNGPQWIGVFHLKDGRFAVLRAGCDYTGWG